jgi:hypothetical protein
VAAYAALAADDIRAGLAVGGGVAVALFAVGLVGAWAPLVQLALSLVVAEYAAYLLERGDVDARAPLVAAALLASGELAYTSIEPPARRTWPFSLALVAGAAVVGSLLLGAAGASTGGLGALVVGVVAAVGALALVARLAATAVRR